MFNREELVNIFGLISRANITGQEATMVAMLQQKIRDFIKAQEIRENEKPSKGSKS